MNPDVRQRRTIDYSIFKIAMGYMGEGGGGRRSLGIGRKDEIPKDLFKISFKNNIIIIGKFSKSTIIYRKSSTASVNQLFQI